MTSLSWQIFAAVQVIVRLQRQVCEVTLNQRAPHAGYLFQIFQGFERTVLVAVAHDGLGFFQPDTVHGLGEILG